MLIRWGRGAPPYAQSCVGFVLQSVYENGPETITLFLHGLNSNAGTWDILNFDEYYDNCLKVTATDVGSASSKPAASCYLYTFMDRDANGSSWPAGDGSTFGQLGEETGKVVDWIRSRHNLRVSRQSRNVLIGAK